MVLRASLIPFFGVFVFSGPNFPSYPSINQILFVLNTFVFSSFCIYSIFVCLSVSLFLCFSLCPPISFQLFCLFQICDIAKYPFCGLTVDPLLMSELRPQRSPAPHPSSGFHQFAKTSNISIWTTWYHQLAALPWKVTGPPSRNWSTKTNLPPTGNCNATATDFEYL